MARSLEEVLAERLRACAAERGLPLSHVADRAGMARSYLWRLLAVQSSATLEAVQRLAVVLEVEALELLAEPTPTARYGKPPPGLATERVHPSPEVGAKTPEARPRAHAKRARKVRAPR